MWKPHIWYAYLKWTLACYVLVWHALVLFQYRFPKLQTGFSDRDSLPDKLSGAVGKNCSGAPDKLSGAGLKELNSVLFNLLCVLIFFTTAQLDQCVTLKDISNHKSLLWQKQCHINASSSIVSKVATLLTPYFKNAITSLWRYCAQGWNVCQIKAPWSHFLLVSITQNDQIKTHYNRLKKNAI